MNSVLSMLFKWISCGLGLFFEQMQSAHVWWAISELKGLQRAGYKEDTESSPGGLIWQCREIRKRGYVLWNGRGKATTGEGDKNQILATTLRATRMHTQSKNCCCVLTEDKNNTPEGERKMLWEKKKKREQKGSEQPYGVLRLGTDRGHVGKTTCEVG